MKSIDTGVIIIVIALSVFVLLLISAKFWPTPYDRKREERDDDNP